MSHIRVLVCNKAVYVTPGLYCSCWHSCMLGTYVVWVENNTWGTHERHGLCSIVCGNIKECCGFNVFVNKVLHRTLMSGYAIHDTHVLDCFKFTLRDFRNLCGLALVCVYTWKQVFPLLHETFVRVMRWTSWLFYVLDVSNGKAV